jgi:hypothetical protein
LESDPIGLEAAPNTYSYVGGNALVDLDPLGLYSWSEFGDDAANAAVGFGDGVSFGATKWYRDWRGIDGTFDKCAGLYRLGDLAGGLTAPIGRFMYIARVTKLANKVPRTVADAVGLSSERNAIKREFRSVLRGFFWDYKDPGWAAQRFAQVGGQRFAASAGKSNFGFDAIAGFGAINAVSKLTCECQPK